MTPLPPPQMLKLPTFQPAEIDAPAQMFRCEFYRATIAAGVCVARQQHRYAPRLAGGKVGVARVTVQYQHCASGKCEQGNTIAAALKDHKPETEEEKKDRRRKYFTKIGQAEVAEIEKVLEETAADPPPAMEPASPAEETRVAEAIEEEKQQVCDGCGKNVRRGRDGEVPEKCFRCRLKAGEVSGHKGRPPRKAKKAATLVDVAKKHTGKPILKDAPYAGPVSANDDVVVLLQQKRQHHLDQAARIDKALEALA